MQPLNYDTPVIDELGKVHPLNEYVGGDISDAIPIFTTDDTIQNPTKKVSMPLFQSGNTLKDLLRWISKGFQNIRYLLKFTEDISDDLNTTIEKVEDINTNLVKEWTDTSVAIAGEYYFDNGKIWKALVDTANTPSEGSEWHNVKVMDEVSELNSNINQLGFGLMKIQRKSVNVTANTEIIISLIPETIDGYTYLNSVVVGVGASLDWSRILTYIPNENGKTIKIKTDVEQNVYVTYLVFYKKNS